MLVHRSESHFVEGFWVAQPFRIIGNNPLDSQSSEFLDVMNAVDRPHVNVEAGFPRLVQKGSSRHFLLNVNRSSTDPFNGAKRIFSVALTVNHPDARFRSKLPNTVQAVIIE